MKLKKLIMIILIFVATICIGSAVQAFTITLDPGHGGTIPDGVTGESEGTEYNGLAEKDINELSHLPSDTIKYLIVALNKLLF